MRKNPWLTLTVVAVAQFMVVLDLTIVNVALPKIQADLHFSSGGLQWIVNAYTLLFGGLLLVGGRAADLLGRRRMFIAGLVVFTAASLVAGFSQSSGMMIAARAAQGLGAAMLSPAALSLLTVTFPHGRERNLAMGIWAGLAGIGGTLGVVLGGVLVDAISWRAVFFVNLPVGMALALIAPVLIAESRRPAQAGPRRLDLAGALLGTGGVLALVFGIVRTQAVGWGSVQVVATLAAGVALLGAFVMVELRAAEPLLPMRLFIPRGMRSGTPTLALNGAAFLGMFFLTALFLQQVRHASPLQTGLQLLPMGIASVLGAVSGSTLVTRLGTRSMQAIGSLLAVVALVLLSRAGASDPYASALLPGFLLFGWGIIWIGVPAQIAAVAELQDADAGAAAAIINTAFQVGGALGLAVITTLANSRASALTHSGHPAAVALTGGYQRGLIAAAVVAALTLAAALLSPQLRPEAGTPDTEIPHAKILAAAAAPA